LGGRSGHNAWMSNYVARKSEEHSMDVDSWQIKFAPL
jgi:predicted P-loop ATPase/GTPase